MKKQQVSTEEMAAVHPSIPEAYEQLVQGRVSRREFLRTATLLGMSIGTATIAAQCGGAPAPTAAPSGGDSSSEPEPVAEEPTVTPEPTATPEGTTIKRGGVMRVGTQVKAVDHPARFAWIFDANQFRHTLEYLTETDKDNITHPYLLESWEPNEDLTVWTLKLREDIMWSNGDELVAEHIVYSFGEWLNPENGSSVLGLWEGFLTVDGIEVVDDHTVRLNLDAPLVTVPELLFHYPAAILHPSFDGDISSGKNPTTGPMALDEFKVGERVIVSRREGYWQKGEDGEALPYLDGIEWVDLGEDQTAHVAALQSGQVHNIYDPSPDSWLVLRNDPNTVVKAVGTSQARVFRVRVDQPPFDNQDVRNAIKMLQDRQKILDQAYYSEGLLGHDIHIAPVQPEFAPMDVPEYDPEGAKALLAEAGQEGLSFELSIGTGWPDVVTFAEVFAEDAKAAGVTVRLDTMPNSSFWEIWSEATVAITPWSHRPLAVMLLPLAYIADSEGNPVPWNESRWVDEEFSTLLKKAQGTFDIEARRAIMADIQAIMQTRGPVLIPFWKNIWGVYNPAFQNAEAHPSNYNLWREVWYDPDKDPFA